MFFIAILTMVLTSCGLSEKEEAHSLNLNRSSITMKIGDTARLSVSYSNNEDVMDAEWLSDNVSVATVSDNGKIEAVGVGDVVVSVSDGKGQTKECDVKVERIAVDEVEINKKHVGLAVNKTVQLQADIYPENATDQNLKWISDDETIAMVDSNGLVTGKSAGMITSKSRNLRHRFMEFGVEYQNKIRSRKRSSGIT